jgi:hypothetical protein
MPSQLEQIQFNYSKRVPAGCIPLAYLNVPTPDPGQDVKLVGTGKYTVDNRDGVVIKNEAPSITINQKNIINSLAVSGAINLNKVADPTFQYGFVPSGSATWTVLSGNWEWNYSNGRTTENSTFDTGDDPAIGQQYTYAPYCAAVTWSNGTSQASIETDFIEARVAGQEAIYSMDNVVYQASLWIASDPVDSYGNRKGSIAGQLQDISDTRITISVVAYNSTGGVIGTLWTGNIGWPYYNTRNYLSQPVRTYLRYRSPYIRLSDPNISDMK